MQKEATCSVLLPANAMLMLPSGQNQLILQW